MKRNRKMFIVGTTIVSVLLTVFIAASYFIRLDEVLYFKVDGELEVFEDEDMSNFYLNVQFITNIDDNRTLIGIQLFDSDATHYESFDSLNVEPQTKGLYKYYNFRTPMITYRENIPESSKITDVALYYHDGSVENMDLRNVDLIKSVNKSDAALEMKEVQTGHNFQETRYDVIDTITLKSLSSSILDKYPEFITVTINGENYKDFENATFYEGDTLTIETKINEAMNNEFPLTTLNMVLRLEYEENGSIQYYDTSHELTQFEFSSFINLYKQIKRCEGR